MSKIRVKANKGDLVQLIVHDQTTSSSWFDDSYEPPSHWMILRVTGTFHHQDDEQVVIRALEAINDGFEDHMRYLHQVPKGAILKFRNFGKGLLPDKR